MLKSIIRDIVIFTNNKIIFKLKEIVKLSWKSRNFSNIAIVLSSIVLLIYMYIDNDV